MTTNLQLSTTESKKATKTKTTQTTRTGTESHGGHTEGYQRGGEGGRVGEKIQGIRSINSWYKIDRGRLRIV